MLARLLPRTKGSALWIVFRGPDFGDIGIREDSQVIAVFNLLAGVDVDKDDHLDSLP
jgi:hypothetical protein